MPTLQDVRNQLAKALADLDSILEPSGTIDVLPGMNLAAMIEDNPANTTFRLHANYMYSGVDFDISKPTFIVNKDIATVPDKRVDNSYMGPIIRSQIGIKAPGVRFGAIRIEGTNPHRKLILADDTGLDTSGLSFDRCVVLGSPQGQLCGVSVYDRNFRAAKSHIGNFWYQGRDSQALATERGMIDAVIDDCFLEGSGENFMAGGWELKEERFIPSNIEFNNCHFFKPTSWKSKPGSVKNLFELKAARNVKLKNCIFENNWLDAQHGFGIQLTTRNQNGNDPFSIVENILFEDCVLKNAAQAVNILGRDDTFPSQVMNGVTFKNFKIEGLNWATNGGNGNTFQIQGGPKNLTLDNVVVDRMPGVTTHDLVNSFLRFGTVTPATENLIVRNCNFVEGEYGIHRDGGTPGIPSLEQCAPNYKWETVKVKKSGYRFIAYPAGTIFV